MYSLEDQLEQLKEESARAREDDAVERDRLEGLTAALKEVSDICELVDNNSSLIMASETGQYEGSTRRDD